jgi:hypothetical protein
MSIILAIFEYPNLGLPLFEKYVKACFWINYGVSVFFE